MKLLPWGNPPLPPPRRKAGGISPRERWLAVLRREKTDRIPMDYWATEEATENLLRHLGLSDVAQMFERLHLGPVIAPRPRYIGPISPRTRRSSAAVTHRQGQSFSSFATAGHCGFGLCPEVVDNLRIIGNGGGYILVLSVQSSSMQALVI